MTLGERIRKLRRELDLTQSEFAGRIGTTANVMTNYEKGRRNPSKSVINNICKTFDVSEAWLRTGEGEMFLAKPSAALDALAQEYRLSNGEYVLIEKFLNLKPDTRAALLSYMREVSASLSAMETEGSSADLPAYPPSVASGVPRTTEDVESQAAAFRGGLMEDAWHLQMQESAEPPEEKAARLEKENAALKKELARLEGMEADEAV